MNETNLSREDLLHFQINFWLFWTIANTIGVTMGLIMGEDIGRYLSNNFSGLLGTIVGGLVFEFVVLFFKYVVFKYYKGLKVLHTLDILVWIWSGVAGSIWIIANAKEFYGFTLIPLIGVAFDVFVVLSFKFFKILKGFRLRKDKHLSLKAVSLAFVSVISAIIIVILSFVISWYYGKEFEAWTPNTQLLVTGLSLGSLLGCSTGIVFASEIPMAIQVGENVDKIMQIRRKRKLDAQQKPFWSQENEGSKIFTKQNSLKLNLDSVYKRKRPNLPNKNLVRKQIIRQIKRKYKL